VLLTLELVTLAVAAWWRSRQLRRRDQYARRVDMLLRGGRPMEETQSLPPEEGEAAEQPAEEEQAEETAPAEEQAEESGD